jgi:hypothetical protein
MLTPAQLQQLYANGHQLSLVPVGLQKNAGNMNLNWPQGTLLQAPTLSGPWTAVANTSPFSLSPTNPSMFYRVLLQ